MAVRRRKPEPKPKPRRLRPVGKAKPKPKRKRVQKFIPRYANETADSVRMRGGCKWYCGLCQGRGHRTALKFRIVKGTRNRNPSIKKGYCPRCGATE